jgi:hypothetical protein
MGAKRPEAGNEAFKKQPRPFYDLGYLPANTTVPGESAEEE